MERVVGKRAVEGDNVRFTVYGIKRFVLYTGNIGRRLIISDYLHSEALADIDEYASDLTRTYNADCLAVKIKTR